MMHEHEFQPTKSVYYVCPLSRRWECSCGAYENRSEGPGIEVLTNRQAFERFPERFKHLSEEEKQKLIAEDEG